MSKNYFWGRHQISSPMLIKARMPKKTVDEDEDKYKDENKDEIPNDAVLLPTLIERVGVSRIRIFFIKKSRQSGETSWCRACYQLGLLCLGYTTNTNLSQFYGHLFKQNLYVKISVVIESVKEVYADYINNWIL